MTKIESVKAIHMSTPPVNCDDFADINIVRTDSSCMDLLKWLYCRKAENEEKDSKENTRKFNKYSSMGKAVATRSESNDSYK